MTAQGRATPYAILSLFPAQRARSVEVCAALEREFGDFQRDAPRWLGSFNLAIWGHYRRVARPLPPALRELTTCMIDGAKAANWEMPEEGFTTVFVQRYDRGDFVAPHVDPLDNLHSTLILSLGDYTGPLHTIGTDSPIFIPPGSMLRLPCRVGAVRGPRHSVSPIEAGVRWAIILNKIEGQAVILPTGEKQS